MITRFLIIRAEIIRFVSIFLIMAFVGGSGTPVSNAFVRQAPVPYSKEPDPRGAASLDELYIKLIEAYKRKDASAVADLYSDASFLLAPDRGVLRGKAAISQEISKYFSFVEKRKKDLFLQIDIIDRQIMDHTAADVGIYTVREVAQDGDVLHMRGKFMAVAEQTPSGEWQFTSRSDSFIPPPKASRNTLFGPTFDSDAFKAEIDRVIEEQMKALSIPGAAVAVVKDGKIVYAKGYGVTDLKIKKPVVPETTIFRIGSITKVFTAMAALQVVDAGKVRLNDDVNKYLKNVKVPETYSTPITLASLLTHSSGLDEISPGRRTSDRTKLVPLEKFLKMRLVRRLPPGEVISYSTYNSALAGYLVETISGKSLHEYFRTEIFGPLQMERSSLASVPDTFAADLATGYSVDDGKAKELLFQWFNTYPASDINSTVLDMGKFTAALLNRGAFMGGRVLSSSSAGAMLRKQFSTHHDIPGYTYGLQEWERNGVRFVEHGGSMDDGYSALLSMIPEEGFGFFVACNTENGGFALGNGIKIMILNKYFPNTPVSKVVKTYHRSTDLRRFAGKYQNDIYCHSCPAGTSFRPTPFEVKVGSDQMLEFWGRSWRQVAPLEFIVATGPWAGQVKVAFRENPKGEITYMFQDWSTFERVP